MGVVEEEQQLPLLGSFSSSADTSEEVPIDRTGTIWTALAHIITGVIGAGVLSLAWSTAQLGWIAGPLCMLAFAAVTIVSASLLCDCYRYPDPEFGSIRIRSYMQAVKFYLGDKSQKICGVFAQESLYGCGITYTITTASSIRFHCCYKSWPQLKAPKLSLILYSKCTVLQGRCTLSPNFIAYRTVNWINMAVDHSLELAKDSCDDDGQLRTGTLWSGVAHIITAVIGSGVLSLAWSTSQLGWIAGPIALLSFAIITYVSAFLLADCYRSPDPIKGTRNRTYMDAVRLNLGRIQTWFCGLLQNLSFYGTAVAYVITTSTSMRAIQKSNCYHREGHDSPCEYGTTFYMLLFGAVQIVVSQIPDFHNMEWLSVIAAIMSFTYSFIGFGLGFAKVIENGTIKGSITGVPAANIADKLWLAFQALGDIAFAYPYTIILLEIQDTLKSPPPENKIMKKASMISIFVTTFFYLCCGCFGYAAFGNDTPGNLLTGFGFYEPYWLIDFANACIVLHLVGGYQIYSQPVFAFVERWFARKFPNSVFVNKFFTFKLPSIPPLKINLFRICFRTVYVMSTTAIAILFPYFNQVLGVLGALNFWPLAIYFPVEMYFVQKKIRPWTRKWIVLRTFSFICLLITIIGLIGSIEGLIAARFG